MGAYPTALQIPYNLAYRFLILSGRGKQFAQEDSPVLGDEQWLSKPTMVTHLPLSQVGLPNSG